MLGVHEISKTFHGRERPVAAVGDVSFSLEKGSRMALIGPSGCGKTTILRCIAGLESPDAGRIVIDGITVFDASKEVDVPPWKRPVGLIFQGYALWPHMSVLENVMFPLGTGSVALPKKVRRERARAALSSVFLEGLDECYPAQLSGGQQQRLALARSLVSEPRVLLMDEPMSNLDQMLRNRMRMELIDILDRASITTILVTHDPTDAFIMAHLTALLDAGRLIQDGPSQSLFDNPRSIRAAEILSGGCRVDCSVRQSGDSGKSQLHFGDSEQFLLIPQRKSCDKTTVLFRPGCCSIAIKEARDERGIMLSGQVRRIYRTGAVTMCLVSIDGVDLEALWSEAERVCVGDEVKVTVDTSRLLVEPLT
jgi:iron(III) transport system ATP-binding protein